MYANYHTHTYLCMHAEKNPRAYVEEGIKNGLKILGFSDHVPYPLKDGFISNYRMKVEETETYVKMISELREEYKNDIKIYIGYEAEYYPESFEAMLRNIEKYGYDYLILGQHALYLESDMIYSSAPTSDDSRLLQYVSRVTEGMKTGKFMYLAHPDIINYHGNENFYLEQMGIICDTALKCDMPLEFNLLGFEDKRNYPNEKFWRLVCEKGNKVILGSDAHRAVAVGNPEITQAGEKMLKDLGIIPIEINGI